MIRATYRMQLHHDFTFADAEARVPYLAALGISHLYCSPVTTAASGSTHGYDVIDPTAINPELGGEAGFRALVATLRAHGLGAIIDIVPNHMGVAGGGNRYWNDVLARGRGSEYANMFDIDWSRPILLPVLGDPLAKVLADGQIEVADVDGRPMIVAYGEHRFPLRPEDEAEAHGADIAELLDRQHYRLGWWRTANDELNWRRFFTVNELAGVRQEEPSVFDLTHALPLRLYAEGLIDGVRVDHVDGLTDPAGYCRRLRAELDARTAARPADVSHDRAYFVVEKILGAGERLATDWGIDGTSGYDFMEEAAALLHAPDGEAPLNEAWGALSGRSPTFGPEERRARADMLGWAFEGQLAGVVDALHALAASAPATSGLTAGMLRRAVQQLLYVFPVYRTYGTGDAAPSSDAAVRAQVLDHAGAHAAPGERGVLETILGWLAGEGPGDAVLAAEAVRRFQQLSAPIAAKAVEDTAFYRYGRLLSRNDVGFDATRFSESIDAFHEGNGIRAVDFPRALLATATHDHKRGEDVRARLAVLSEVPHEWAARVAEWLPLTAAIDAGDGYMLLQTLVGAWPDELAADDVTGLAAFGERVTAWQEKAVREAKLRSSWEAPDADYEGAARDLVTRLLDPTQSGAFLRAVAGFVAWLRPAADANSLAQTALRCTVPGIPDLYQGCELPDLSLVDPDNRRPVDYPMREALLAGGGAPKLALIAELLGQRKAQPALFADGEYVPLTVVGPRAGNVLAFERRHGDEAVRVVVALRCAAAVVGGDARVPAAEWWDGTGIEGAGVAELLRDGPVSARRYRLSTRS